MKYYAIITPTIIWVTKTPVSSKHMSMLCQQNMGLLGKSTIKLTESINI